MINYIALPLVGFVTGAIVVVAGVGGGAVYMGLLTVLFKVPPAIAASTSLATIIPTTVVGVVAHWRAGNVRPRVGLLMLAGGVVGAITGSLCSGLLPTRLYGKLAGALLVVLTAQMLVAGLRKRSAARAPAAARGVRPARVAVAVGYGLLSGALSGLVGLSGGGPILVGLMVLGCSPLESAGTSLLVILGIATTGFLAHISLGSVDWLLVLLLATGTASGAFTAPLLLKRVDRNALEKVLGPTFIVILAVMGIVLLAR